MENIKTENQSAFPYEHAGPFGGTISEKGMTLRDYFAAKAVQGILSGVYSSPAVLDAMNEICKSENIIFRDDISERAYKIADAMLKERLK